VLPTVNSFDTLAFRATLRGPGGSAATDSAIYSVADYHAAPTALNYRLRLREGSAVPAEPGASVVGGALPFTLGEPRVNGKETLQCKSPSKPARERRALARQTTQRS
jgi:hypothetical protein